MIKGISKRALIISILLYIFVLSLQCIRMIPKIYPATGKNIHEQNGNHDLSQEPHNSPASTSSPNNPVDVSPRIAPNAVKANTHETSCQILSLSFITRAKNKKSKACELKNINSQSIIHTIQ